MHRYPRRYLLIAAMTVSLITSLDVALWVTAGAAPQTGLMRLYYFVTVILLVAWLSAEPRVPAENRPTFDHGYLHWATFPLLGLYEQIVCRGARGIEDSSVTFQVPSWLMAKSYATVIASR